MWRVVFVGIALFATTVSHAGPPINVCSSCTHTTINSAMSSASAGDTIQVAAGTYSETLLITKDLIIEGAGSATTTISGSSGELIEIDGSTPIVKISGFSLRVSGNGRAMRITDGDVKLDDIDVSGVSTNYWGPAIGVIGASSSLTATNLNLNNNTSTGYGGHINCWYGTLDISTSTISNGIGTRYGGAFRLVGCDTLLDDVTFLDNFLNAAGGSDHSLGGAIFGIDSDVTIQNSTFDGNESDEDGGAIGAYTGHWVVENTRFTGNAADDDGGAIYNIGMASPSGSWTITDSIFTNNTADADLPSSSANHHSGGGAIWMSDKDLILTGSVFSGNNARTSDGDGGAIWLHDGLLSVTDCAFQKNTADAGDGLGGSIYLKDGDLSLTDSQIDDSSASSGGGVYLMGVDTAEAIRNRFCSNTALADEGGGLYIEDVGTTVSDWRNNVFVENIATGQGGGVYVDSSRTQEFYNNSFLGNSASDGGGYYSVTDNFFFVNNILAYTVTGNGLSLGSSSSGYVIDYNDRYSNSANDWGSLVSSVGSNNPTDLPDLVSYSLDGDCENDDLRLDVSSKLIDAGDPSILDPDSSRSDIGAYGGIYADASLIDDVDMDGYIVM